MYVVTLIYKGKLLKSAIRGNANEAVSLAHSWVENYKNKYKDDGYISIDEQVKNKGETQRFIEIKFDSDPDKVLLYLRDQRESPVFASKFQPIAKKFLSAFLEFAIIKMTEYLKQKDGRK